MEAPIDLVKDVLVSMRDGVRLATDIYRPDGAPRRTPVLLCRTPYSKDEMAERFGFSRFFAEHGYVVVQQDCRGCFKSEGDIDFLQSEAADGYDTLRWIETQEWGDADVGAWGTSWSAWTQTAMAAMGPSRLKTIVPMMSGSDAWSSSVRHGGALELRWIAWAFWHAAENTQRALNKTPGVEEALIRPQKRFSDWLRDWPIRRGETQLALTPAYEKWVFDLIEHSERSAYWNTPSLNPAAHRASVQAMSTLIIGSWYDSYTRATFENFLGIQGAGTGKTRLMVGPWAHGTATVEQAFAGNIAFSADAAIADYKKLLRAWFDRELKNVGPGVQADETIRLYVMGGGEGQLDSNGRLGHGGRWRSEHEWPLARTQFQRFYLTADGALSEAGPLDRTRSRSFSYDPSDPVPTIGGNVSSLLDVSPDAPPPAQYHRLPHLERTTPIVAPGGYDQCVTAATYRLNARTGALAKREDVLVFETAPLAKDVEATGPIVVCLFVSTDAPDADFTAKIVDVYPPSRDFPQGYALNLTDSIVRLSHRDGSGNINPVQPGEIMPVTITLYPTSNIFVAGHRIRLDVSGSNFPRFDRNPHASRHTVYFNAQHPSHIVLPVIPT